ncbi:MAG: hypothetical protein WAV90_00740 [Gordonia amarae]
MSIWDLAKDEDSAFREDLEKVSLVFELNYDEDKFRRCQQLYGRVANLYLRTGTYQGLIKDYRGLTLVTLVGHAGLAYEQGAYWDSFWDELGMDRNPEFEGALRHSIPTLLKTFSLREFDDIGGLEFVYPLAMHAGIPVYCLDDLIDLIEDHIQQGRDAHAAAVLYWLTEPGMEYRLNRLDVPVRNFLQYGGDMAVDVLNRIIDFLVFTMDEPAVWNNLDLTTATTGLPELILGALIDRVCDRPFLSAGDARVRERTRRRRTSPAISYSHDNDEIIVGVPYPDSAAESPWTVSIGGKPRDVYAERGWGTDDDHPLTPVTITSPATEVILVHKASRSTHRVPLFTAGDPMMLFDADGRLIQPRAKLPRGEVFVVHPKDAEVLDASTREPVGAVDDPATPSGWKGWRAYTLDLTGHTSIVASRGGHDGEVRGVRSVGKPTLDCPDFIPGLYTVNGLGVFGELPQVGLPPHLGATPEVWRVRTRRVGDREWLTDDEWESDNEETVLNPFCGVEDALLGSYEIVVNGAAPGSDQRYTVFIAEGISIDYGTQFRLPAPGGLAPTTAEIASELDLEINWTTVEFGVNERESDVRVGPAGHNYRLIVRPPHVEFRVDKLGTPATWRTAALTLSPADFKAHAMIALRAHGVEKVEFALLDSAGEVRQRESVAARTANVAQLVARSFADTARHNENGSLVAYFEDADGQRHQVTLGDIRPTRLCSSIAVAGKQLVVKDLADLDDLAVWTWSATAPWQEVVRLPIDRNRVELPDHLRGAGDLLVEVFRDDPFATVNRPNRPGPNAMRATQAGWMRDDDAVREQLSCFLAGDGKPPRQATTASDVWAALAVLPWDRDDASSWKLRTTLLGMLRRYPRAALDAAGHSALSQHELVPLLVEAELAERQYSGANTFNELHPNQWVGCMFEISDLLSLARRAPKVAVERAETIAYLRKHGGESLMELLRSGTLSKPKEGIFDAGSVHLDALSVEQTDAIREEFRLVPGAELDSDNRTSAILYVFTRRQLWVSDPLHSAWPKLIEDPLRQLEAVSPVLHSAVCRRIDSLGDADTTQHPWLMLSVYSLTCAAVARLAARGEFEESPMTPELRRAWVAMAQVFPNLVAVDLLMAEAYVTYLTDGNLIGETA